MCGFTGFWDPRGDRGQDRRILNAMSDTILHRGPDDSGTFFHEESGLALGHRRLSILDLSQEGHQPMCSASGRFVIVYNGEVYNFREMSAELSRAGFQFRGGSDTEVLLAAFEHWGVKAALQRFVGMFAFALYDRQQHQLILARDRAGIKPLYYSVVGDCLMFGSELKCLNAHPRGNKEINPRALHHYLRLGYIPAPLSIYKQVQKLQQGHMMVWSLANGTPQSEGPEAFWMLNDVVDESRQHPIEGDWMAGLRHQLDRAVGDRLVADVPLGAFLSGGIDSTLVVATMQRLAPGSVKTFSIGFDDGGFNEAAHAREIAEHLGTQHHELYFKEQQLLDLVPKLPQIWCEPFGDSSQLPTLLLAQFAREHVTVALSGDGGDELAGGYVRHLSAARLSRLHARYPAAFRRLVSSVLTGVPTATWDQVFKLVPKKRRIRLPGDKLHKLGRALKASDRAGLYDDVVALDTLGPLLEEAYQPPRGDDIFPWPMPTTPLTPAEDFMVRDFYRYMADDILTKVDRATMAVSLEARVPLMDHRLVAHMWRMPENLKIREGVGKFALRELLAQDVPRALWERPKMGFAAPVGTWVKTVLKSWCEDLLQDVATGKVPWLNKARVAQLWSNHLAGRGNTISPLWHLLMFLAWHREHGPHS